MSNVQFLQVPSEEEGLQSRRARMTQLIHSAVQSGGQSIASLPAFLKEALQVKAWLDRPTPLGKIIHNESFREWVSAGYPHGIGASPEVIQNLLRDDMEARSLFDEAIAGRHGGAHNPNGRNQHSEEVKIDNIKLDQPKVAAPTGTTIDAGLRRLRKEAQDKIDPETGEVLIAGNAAAKDALSNVLAEKVSVHKALVDIGIRKPTVTIRDEPEAVMKVAIKKSGAYGAAVRAWRDMTEDERVKFLDWAGANVRD